MRLSQNHRVIGLFLPSDYINTLILMMQDARFSLDQIQHIQNDKALTQLLGLNNVPAATSLGDWLRRMGKIDFLAAWHQVNKTFAN